MSVRWGRCLTTIIFNPATADLPATRGERNRGMNHQELIKQLGGNRFIAMTGAKNFIGHENGISFKIMRNPMKVTHVAIDLDPSDTYTLEFLNIKTRPKLEKSIISTRYMVYGDQLQEIFTRETGLDTHL